MEESETPKRRLELEMTGDFETRKGLIKLGHEHEWCTKNMIPDDAEDAEWIVFCRLCGVRSFD